MKSWQQLGIEPRDPCPIVRTLVRVDQKILSIRKEPILSENFLVNPKWSSAVHTEWLSVLKLKHSVPLAIYGEDCEDWWLPGGCSSVVRALAPQVRGSGFDSWQLPVFHFLLLRLKTNNLSSST